MLDKEDKKFVEYLQGKRSTTVPLLQEQFGLGYAEAKKAMDKLCELGAVEFDAGIEYRVLDENVQDLLYEAAKEEKLDARMVAELRDRLQLEKHRSSVLARLREMRGDRSQDDEDILIALKKEDLSLKDLVSALEKGIEARGRRAACAVTAIAELGLSYDKTLALLCIMQRKGYLEECEHDSSRYRVVVPPEELRRLKKLADKIK